MKVMYVAPRYHTNQIPIMKGWIENGDEVCFISQYCGGTEDYSILKPEVLGYSAVFRMILSVYHGIQKIMHTYVENDYNFQAKFGFLPVKKFRRFLDLKKPDLVILRDRSLYNIAITTLCRKKKIPCILYTQSPYVEEGRRKDDLIRRYFRAHTPSVRITPVWGKGKNEGEADTKNTWYVPFVIEPCQAPHEKEYFREQKIHLLGVGKYEERKHHEMLLRLAGDIKEAELYVTIAGEAVTNCQKEHFESLRQYVREHDLEKKVSLKKNLTLDQVYEEYKKADLFLLPSTGEFASVSQLEAMSCSVPVICSDTNGTACYVEHDGNGYLFQDNNYEDFRQYAMRLIQDRKKLLAMGERSWQLVNERYVFSNYRDKIAAILNKMEGMG